MIRLPTFKQLKYLTAVVEHAHFGRAATACNVSQSTLSAGIAELEHILGVSLLERDQKGVKLLPIGKEISQRAQDILTSTKDLVDTASAAQLPFTTELKLGVIPTIAPFILPKMLNHVRTLFPDFKIYIREAMSEPLVNELQAGQLDILLLALPYPAERVHSYHLYNDDFVLAVPKDHSLAEHKTASIQELKNQELLLLEDGHCIRDHALDACFMKSEDLNIPYQATSLNTVTQMVANGMGVTILPQMAIEANLIEGTKVTSIPFIEKDIYRSIGLMWRQNTPRIKEFRALGDLVKDSI